MGPKYEQMCLVCGQRTTQRCSSCAKAGIDLYFCSPEHQKLVWKVHRTVCGPGKANPFLWPLLTQEEVDERSMVANALTNLLSIPVEEIPNVIHSLTLEKSADLLGRKVQQLALTVIRAHMLARTIQGPQAPDRNSTLADAVKSFPWYEFNSARGRDKEAADYGREPWRTRFRHQMLIYLVLVNMARLEEPYPAEEWLDRLYKRNIEFMKTDIAVTHPGLAQYMLTLVELAMLQMCQMSFADFPS